jgi:saccharopine dehydrogenase-like NADP-dependent oxidoreductase
LPLAQNKTENHPNAIALDIFDANQRKEAIEKADMISMLPAHLHIEVARDCVV